MCTLKPLFADEDVGFVPPLLFHELHEFIRNHDNGGVSTNTMFPLFISSVKEISLSAGKRMLLICSGVRKIRVPGISISKKFIIETNSLHWVLKELIRKNHDRIPWEGDRFDF